MTLTLKESFDRASSQYDCHCDLQKNIGTTLIHLLTIQRKEYPHVIDLGCGTGFITNQLATCIQYKSFHAIDFSDAMIAHTKSQLSFPISYGIGDFDHLPMKGDGFDLIFSNMALHWSKNLNQTLENIPNQLNHGGMIAISLPLRGSLQEMQSHFAINPFPEIASLITILQKTHCQLLHVNVKSYVLSFQSTYHALKSIKQIGSRLISQRPQMGLMSQSLINKFGIKKLTYQIGYLIGIR